MKQNKHGVVSLLQSKSLSGKCAKLHTLWQQATMEISRVRFCRHH